MTSYKLQVKKGFTLIETMVAVSIFTIVMTLGTGAVVNTNATYKRTQALRQALDSMSFAMEDMVRNIRLGSSFYCGQELAGQTTPNTQDCSSGENTTILFDKNDSGILNRYAYTISSTGITKEIYDPNGISGGARSLVPSEIKINTGGLSGFIVVGSPPAPSDKVQPRIIIKISGTASYRNLKSDFNLETTVSPRLIDR
ncbi:MAG: type II secretion system protein [Candidatus Paceibacterota bacterium]|jgi:prepilin-type N-terminal cleavage/methylation domain-containing protein